MDLKSKPYKLIELLLLFVIIPISFSVEYSLIAKAIIGLFGFIYVIFIILKVENINIKINKKINWSNFWYITAFRTVIIVLITTFYVYAVSPNDLFLVVISKPLLFILILFVYSIFSVYPQELIYRTFFFSRYSIFFRNTHQLIFINAVLFSLAHLFFNNILVSIITFVGGLLFATTFMRTKSTLLVSIEHAIYGCWLFTIGMGSILGFPT